MARKLNPELKEGDRIILYDMQDDYAVSPGTEGTVLSITRDPFESDNLIVLVNWDDGSRLSILSKYDSWKHAKTNIEESSSPEYDFFSNNEEIFDTFDWRFLRKYLEMIRESGIVNMFGASPLLYAGKEHIDRYYGENPPDEDAFAEVLENANKAKDKMIVGTMEWMRKRDIDISVDSVNSYIRRLSNKILELYISFTQ